MKGAYKLELKDFAYLLVEELVNNKPDRTDVRIFHKNNGLDPNQLNDADVIWKYFVRYNIDTGGVKSATVERQWNSTPQNSVLKNRSKLLEILHDFRKMKPMPKCYDNFTTYCSLQYRCGKCTALYYCSAFAEYKHYGDKISLFHSGSGHPAQ